MQNPRGTQQHTVYVQGGAPNHYSSRSNSSANQWWSNGVVNNSTRQSQVATSGSYISNNNNYRPATTAINNNPMPNRTTPTTPSINTSLNARVQTQKPTACLANRPAPLIQPFPPRQFKPTPPMTQQPSQQQPPKLCQQQQPKFVPHQQQTPPRPVNHINNTASAPNGGAWSTGNSRTTNSQPPSAPRPIACTIQSRNYNRLENTTTPLANNPKPVTSNPNNNKFSGTTNQSNNPQQRAAMSHRPPTTPPPLHARAITPSPPEAQVPRTSPTTQSQSTKSNSGKMLVLYNFDDYIDDATMDFIESVERRYGSSSNNNNNNNNNTSANNVSQVFPTTITAEEEAPSSINHTRDYHASFDVTSQQSQYSQHSQHSELSSSYYNSQDSAELQASQAWDDSYTFGISSSSTKPAVQPRARQPKKPKQENNSNDSTSFGDDLEEPRKATRKKAATKVIPTIDLTCDIEEVRYGTDAFTSFCGALSQQKAFAWQLITTTTDDKKPPTLDGVAFAWTSEKAYIVSAAVRQYTEFLSWLKGVMQGSENVKKMCFDAKTHLTTMLTLGIDVPSSGLMDPGIAHWVIKPSEKEPPTIDDLLQEYAQDFIATMASPKSTSSSDSNDSSKPSGFTSASSWLSEKAREASVNVVKVFVVTSKLDEIFGFNPHLAPPFWEVEMPLVPVLAHMQFHGIGFEKNLFTSYSVTIKARLEELQSEVQQILLAENKNKSIDVRKLSLTAPADVCQMLFDVLKLPEPVESRSKKTKNRSSKAEVLEKLQHRHRIVPLIQEHRKLTTLMTKCLRTYPSMALPARNGDEAHTSVRLFCTFDQTTATGRLASSNPNLQNIPLPMQFNKPQRVLLQEQSEAEERGEDGSLVSRSFEVNLRNAFVASPGFVLLSADYSQIELRILTHFAEDARMMKQLHNNNEDIFVQIAAQINDRPMSDITKDLRDKAKHVCYGIFYGMGILGLAQAMHVTAPEAQMYMTAFKARYSGIAKFMNKAIEDCRKNTYVETIKGRRRYFRQGVGGSGGGEEGSVETKALNTICQGSAADLIKFAMIKILDQFKNDPELNSNNNGERTAPPRLLLQIHDELLFEVREEHLDRVKTIVRDCMENAIKLRVPLPVKLKVGCNWGSMSPCLS